MDRLERLGRSVAALQGEMRALRAERAHCPVCAPGRGCNALARQGAIQALRDAYPATPSK